MSFLVVANFKSHKTTEDVKIWLGEVGPYASMYPDLDIVVAPSFPHLSTAHTDILNSKSNIDLAGQDVSPFPPGSYTGAINAKQLKECDVKYCIVGHSERRRYFHETPTEVSSKVNELLSSGITPILCMEEQDIAPQFAALDDSVVSKCIFCYEPSNDIGGSVTATPEQIKAVKLKVSNFAKTSPFMYGGSVNSDNVGNLLDLGLSGVLVATASLDSASYLSILREVSHAA